MCFHDKKDTSIHTHNTKYALTRNEVENKYLCKTNVEAVRFTAPQATSYVCSGLVNVQFKRRELDITLFVVVSRFTIGTNIGEK